MINKNVRFGIAGYGHIGKRHAIEIINNANAALIAVADISEIARKEAGKLSCAVYNDLDTMLGAEMDLDVVSICTPNGCHINQVENLLNAGVHALVEKPLGLKSEDCLKAIQLASEKGKEIFCVLQNRYSAPATFLKDFVSNGKLGTVFWVDIACYWNRDERYYEQALWRGTNEMDGGTLYTQFSHFIDLLFWIFGPVEPVSGIFSNFSHQGMIDFEDTGSFHFLLPKHGGQGVFSYTTTVPTKNLESSITVIGSNGSIRIGGQYMDNLDHFEVIDEERPMLPDVNHPNYYGTYQGSAANHGAVIQKVVESLNGEQSDIPRAYEAVESVSIIEKAYALRRL